MAQTADKAGEAEDEQQVADDAAGDRRLDDRGVVRPQRAVAMISSAALPNVALRKPPSVGPDRLARCSVADPINPAAGTSEIAAVRKTHIEPGSLERSHQHRGTAPSSRLSQLARSS